MQEVGVVQEYKDVDPDTSMHKRADTSSEKTKESLVNQIGQTEACR